MQEIAANFARRFLDLIVVVEPAKLLADSHVEKFDSGIVSERDA
jgi:hypothetical protein